MRLKRCGLARLLFDSLIISLFTYAIEEVWTCATAVWQAYNVTFQLCKVWACIHYVKYLSQIDRFCKRALRYGYTSKYTPITDVIRIKERPLWDKITTHSTYPLLELLPPQKSRSLRKRGIPLHPATCQN